MPKEIVYGALPAFEADDPGRAQVEVGWDREAAHMQLVTKCVHGSTGGRLFDDDGIHYTDGFYVDLDRQGINDLIRHLRRARDQAFGRDE